MHAFGRAMIEMALLTWTMAFIAPALWRAARRSCTALNVLTMCILAPAPLDRDGVF